MLSCLKKKHHWHLAVTGFSLSNYIKILVQQEACDWTGKREAEQRVAETGSNTGEKKKETKWRTNRIQIPHGFK